MSLPLETRAAAAVVALATTAAIINVVAEIGHPAPDGYGMLAVFGSPQHGSRTVKVAQSGPEALQVLPGKRAIEH